MTPADTLAMYVSLNLKSHEEGCTAWIDSKDDRCKRTPTEGFLCTRHHNIAVKRHERDQEKHRLIREKAAAHRAENLPKWRAELERLNKEMARMWGIPETTDMAAYGGQVNARIARKANAALTDNVVAKGAKLGRRAEELRRKIGDAS